MGVPVVSAGPDRLQVTISPRSSPATPSNRFYVLRANIPTNARLEVINGPGDLSGLQDLPVGDGTQPVVFYVRRIGAGSVTVPLLGVDRCGDWNTFVGGGPNAF